jgi:crossover junction endodeoxyribonuclease RusA
VKELVLPWPDRRLHPNARVHWKAKSPVTKAARSTAHLLALEAGWHRVELPAGKLHVWIDFYPPDRRRRDDDGLLASMKAARDGIADALKVDDNRFVSHPQLMDEVRPGGQVVVRITGSPK